MSALHPLQIEIFERLRTSSDSLRFSELCPKGVETDVFTYHLKQLVKKDYVSKRERRYSLSKAGKEFLVDMSPLRFGQPLRHKIAALSMVFRFEPAGDYSVLYQERLRDPHRGSIVMPAGGVKRGEPVLVAAKRRLLEESGLESRPKWVGALRKIRKESVDSPPWSDITYHICASFNPAGQVVDTKYGRHRWLSLEHAARLERKQAIGSDFLADWLELIDRNAGQLGAGFYFEEVEIASIY